MNKKITGILIDVMKSRSIRIVETGGTLDELYELTNCDCIDIVSRTIGNERYSIVCDDEGLLKNKPITSAIDSDHHPMLVGNLFICKYDEEGDAVSLTDEDIKNIFNNVCMLILPEIGVYQAIKCEY